MKMVKGTKHENIWKLLTTISPKSSNIPFSFKEQGCQQDVIIFSFYTPFTSCSTIHFSYGSLSFQMIGDSSSHQWSESAPVDKWHRWSSVRWSHQCSGKNTALSSVLGGSEACCGPAKTPDSYPEAQHLLWKIKPWFQCPTMLTD